MSENRFITIVTVLVFALSGFIGWHLLSHSGGNKEISIKKPASILSTEGGTDTDEARVIGSRNSVSLTVAADRNRIAYYDRSNGTAFEVGIDGSSEKTLSANHLPNFLSAIWSPNKKEVIGEFAAPRNSKTLSYYNYLTKKSSQLPVGTGSVAFSPSGDRIVYFREDGGQFGVFVSAPDGSSAQRIMSTRITAADIYWPLKDFVGLKSNDENLRSNLFLMSLTGGVTKIVSDKTSLVVNWHPDGKSVLVSYLNEDAQVLSVVDSASGFERIIPISTSANDCAWSSFDSIVCRVNNYGTPQTGGLYEIKTSDGSSAYLEGSGRAVEGINQILVDPANSHIIFTSSKDGRIFSLKR